jgi:hypothetical protein
MTKSYVGLSNSGGLLIVAQQLGNMGSSAVQAVPLLIDLLEETMGQNNHEDVPNAVEKNLS